jgi:hypothetical protein
VAFAEGEKLFKRVFIRDLIKFALPYLAGIAVLIVVLVLFLGK